MSRPHDLRTARLLRLRLSTLSRRRSIRNLQMENLESRVVLSGLPELAASAPETPADIPPAEIELEGPETIVSLNSVAVTPVSASRRGATGERHPTRGTCRHLDRCAGRRLIFHGDGVVNCGHRADSNVRDIRDVQPGARNRWR